LCNYLHTDFILVIRHPTDRNRSGWNMLLNNNNNNNNNNNVTKIIYKGAFVALSYRYEISYVAHTGSKTVSYAMDKGCTVT